MRFYSDHMAHDPTLLYPVRIIEAIPPRRYDVLPRPRDTVRYHYEHDEDSASLFTALDATLDALGPTYRMVAEYAHQAILTEWHTSVAYFDVEAQQYVRVGWYELRSGWWWGPESMPPEDATRECAQRLATTIADVQTTEGSPQIGRAVPP